MDRITRKNIDDWNRYSAEYMKRTQPPEVLEGIVSSPESVFVPMALEQISSRFPSLTGRKVCVPSCGDCHAVYAFALMGAQVTACDLSENQLAAAQRSARSLGLLKSISFVLADTRDLAALPDSSFDLVYTSRGVFVWLDSLDKVFGSFFRVLRPGGLYTGCDIHPFRRPFGENGELLKPYDAVGPFEDEWNVNFHWRVSDILGAAINAGLTLDRIEEISEADDPLPHLPKWLCFSAYRT